jgi:hypothetical protein
LAIVGDEKLIAAAGVGPADHRGLHVFGVPAQLMLPAASNANNLPLPSPIHTIPYATAGDDSLDDDSGPVHSGVQVFGAEAPEQ